MISRSIPFVFVFLWSTGWIVAGFAALDADPLWFLTIRFSIAAAVLALVALAIGAPWPRDPRMIGHAIVAGVLIHGFYLAAVWWAVAQGVPSGISGILSALQPVLTAILAPLVLRETVTAKQALGVGLGFVGVMLVLSPKLIAVDGSGLGALSWPLLINVVGMISVTLGAFYQKRFVTGDLRTTTVWQYIGATVLVLALVPMFGTFEARWTLSLVLTMAWSAIVLSIGSISLFLILIARGEVSRATAYIFLTPPIAAFMAYIAFGETLTLVQLVGMVVTAGGVWLATRKWA